VGRHGAEQYKPPPTLLRFLNKNKNKKKNADQKMTSLSGLQDMTSCGTNCCLYVSDAELSRVHRVDPSHISSSSYWQVDGEPSGLSVDKQGQVHVSCPGMSIIQIYTHGGDLLHKIKPSGVDSGPWHSVPTGGSNWVICYDDQYRAQSLVSVIDSSGNVNPRYKKEELRAPVHLAVDPYSEQILVAEMGSFRIMLLHPAGKSPPRVLINFGMTGMPERLSLCRVSRRLFVGMKDGRVLIYHVIDKAEGKFQGDPLSQQPITLQNGTDP